VSEVCKWLINTLVVTCACGWSEPAATNAPVEDEPVQTVLRMNILPAHRDFFFHLLSASKFFTSPLLPTPSYLPPTKPNPPSYLHPPTYHLSTPPPRHSIAKALETSSGCGVGAGVVAVERELERLELELDRLELERDPRAHEKVRCLRFFFIFFVCFI
jgi:hypothetical protein